MHPQDHFALRARIPPVYSQPFNKIPTATPTAAHAQPEHFTRGNVRDIRENEQAQRHEL